MRAGREIVIIQLPPKVRTKPFSGPDEKILKQKAAYLVVNNTGRPTCNSSSISFGTSHAADTSPQSMSGRPGN